MLLTPPIPLIREQILDGRKTECSSQFWKLKQPRKIGTSQVMMRNSDRLPDPCCDVIGCHPGLFHEIIEPHREVLRSRRQLRSGS
jgi:hypothetical protein